MAGPWEDYAEGPWADYAKPKPTKAANEAAARGDRSKPYGTRENPYVARDRDTLYRMSRNPELKGKYAIGPSGAVVVIGADKPTIAEAPRKAPRQDRQAQGGLREQITGVRRGDSRNAQTEIAGGMANLNAGIPLFDEIVGSLGGAGDILTGKAEIDPAKAAQALGVTLLTGLPGGNMVLGDDRDRLMQESGIAPAFSQGMANQRALQDDFATRRPVAAAGAKGTGSAASSLVPLAGPANTALQGGRAMNAARGATTAAAEAYVHGVTDRGTLSERVDNANLNAAIAAPLGGVLGSLASNAPKKAPRKKSDVAVLKDAGVKLTPGQQAGGPIKLMEDIGARLPITGAAIRGARQRGGESLGRAAANRALAPLGETVPASVPNGADTVRYTSERLGKAFEDAYALVPKVAPDDDFLQGLTGIAPRLSELTPDNQKVLEGILRQRLDRLSGDADGATAGRIRSELAGISAKYLKSGDPNQQALGSVIKDVGEQLDDLIARSDPTGQAGPALDRAREGWGAFAVLRRASAQANGGVVTPQQLASSVRFQDGSVAKGAVARGDARLQDLSGAAARVMPDSFGNPGTADVGATIALGGLALANPPAAAGATAGLSAAALPYFAMARDIAKQVPKNASRAQVQAAMQQLDDLARASPEAAAAIAQLRDQIARSAGAGVASAPRKPPR
jgi:hypothetical protein